MAAFWLVFGGEHGDNLITSSNTTNPKLLNGSYTELREIVSPLLLSLKSRLNRHVTESMHSIFPKSSEC